MRLDEQEYKALEQATCDVEGEMYLFGSRVDDEAKGGDIDLLIVTGEDTFDVSRKVTVQFQMMCDEKIDVLAVSRDNRTDEEEQFLKKLNELVRIK